MFRGTYVDGIYIYIDTQVNSTIVYPCQTIYTGFTRRFRYTYGPVLDWLTHTFQSNQMEQVDFSSNSRTKVCVRKISSCTPNSIVEKENLRHNGTLDMNWRDFESEY